MGSSKCHWAHWAGVLNERSSHAFPRDVLVDAGPLELQDGQDKVRGSLLRASLALSYEHLMMRGLSLEW